MSVSHFVQAWRRSKNVSLGNLAGEAGLDHELVQEVEEGKVDPPLSVLESLASGLGIPPSWLFFHPSHIKLVFADLDDDASWPSHDHPDPVAERILAATKLERELYVLLTALLQNGDPKLLRAAEVNLKSLLKQARKATLPWQHRPSGHFEPPND